MAVLMVLVSAAGFIGAARAQAADYLNYGQIRFGLNDFSGDLEDADYDAGANLAVAYGRYLTPHLVLEAAVDLFGTEKGHGGSTAIAGSYNRDDSIAVVAVLSTLKGEWPAR